MEQDVTRSEVARGSAIVVALSAALVAAPAVLRAAPPSVGVTHALDKVRPSASAPVAVEAAIEAARNEFEPFQIVVHGEEDGATGVSAVASDLVSADGSAISASEITLFREALYQVVVPSSTEGAAGLWPDPLIPDVDPVFGEKRNAFPFDVPPGQARAIWVEVYVPLGTPAGIYEGQVTVTGGGLGSVAVPVTLRVRGFDLPSTATLRSAYGMGWDDGCVAHAGSYVGCGGDAGIDHYHQLYALAALDHRVSLETVVYYWGDTERFDALYAPLVEGTAPTRLPGARLTSIRAGGPADVGSWQQLFDERGYGTVLFDYTCDEPPHGCLWESIAPAAAPYQAAGVPTLVTTDLGDATAQGLTGAIDILTPLLQIVHGKDDIDHRPEYDAFLALSPHKRLWWYQSCISHGCGSGCSPTTETWYSGWPSYVIDVSAIQNRAMEWLSFSYDITGELYFQTTHLLETAWESSCDFSGNGDGTLFYPGTPARVGGTGDIPITSIRLKLIREGMEDYEYLALLSTLGDEELARAQASAVFPKPFLVGATAPATLYEARAALADRIEELLGGGPVTCSCAGKACGPDGCGGSCGDCGEGSVCTAGHCSCASDCAGKVCGDDGCGGSCGACGAGLQCVGDGTSCEAPDVEVLGSIPYAAAGVLLDGEPGDFEGGLAIGLEVADATADLRLLWDEAALYLCAWVSDADLRVNGTGKDGPLWNADGVEVMLDPALTRTSSPDDDDRHVIVTAADDLLDAQGAGAGEDVTLDMDVTRYVAVDGTLGDDAPDSGWRVEMAIPWADLDLTPAGGLRFGADLALNDLDATGYATADLAGLAVYASPVDWAVFELAPGPDPDPCATCEPDETCVDGECVAAPPAAAVLLAPRSGSLVVLDGRTAEFAQAPSLTLTAGGATAEVRFLWRESALFMAAVVRDEDLQAAGVGHDGPLWNADNVELWLDPLMTRGALPDGDDRHFVFSVLGDVLDAQGAGAEEEVAVDYPLVSVVARRGAVGDDAGDWGWVLEASFRWSSLGIKPRVGRQLGADVAVTDLSLSHDGPTTNDWCGLDDVASPAQWNVIELGPLAPTAPAGR